MRYLTFLLCLVFCSPSWADYRDAIVRVAGCSGVCVDDEGHVLTAKHCNLPERVCIVFPDRQVEAVRVYVSNYTEGVLVFDCEGSGYPFIPISDVKPEPGDAIELYGYGGLLRSFLRKPGTVIGGIDGLSYAGQRIAPMNAVTAIAVPGMSGGPMLNNQGTVCGLVSGTDGVSSIVLSWTSITEAYHDVLSRPPPATDPSPQPQPVPQPTPQPTPGPDAGVRKPILYVYVSEGCPPCARWKADYESNRDVIDSMVQVVTRNSTQYPTPTFILVVDSVETARVTGYTTLEKLLADLNLAAQPPPTVPEPQPQPQPQPQPHPNPTPSPGPQPVPDPNPGENPGQITRDPHQRGSQDTSFWGRFPSLILDAGVQSLPWILGVGGATGGTGAAVWGAWKLFGLAFRRKKKYSPTVTTTREEVIPSQPPEVAGGASQAPFPRQLDEARQILELAASERKGYIPVIESLKGLLLQDQAHYLLEDPDVSKEMKEGIRRLIDIIHQRIDEIAPLTVSTEEN